MVTAGEARCSRRGLARPFFEGADLALGFLVADRVSGLQLADEDLATSVDFLEVVVGQFAPLLLRLTLGLRPGTLELGPRHVGFLLHRGCRRLGMDARQRRCAEQDGRHQHELGRMHAFLPIDSGGCTLRVSRKNERASRARELRISWRSWIEGWCSTGRTAGASGRMGGSYALNVAPGGAFPRRAAI